MPLYTKEEIKAKIEALDAKIAKAEEAQSYRAGMPSGPGEGMVHERGSLAAMYRERQYWIEQYERLERLEQGGATNLAKFVRPR